MPLTLFLIHIFQKECIWKLHWLSNIYNCHQSERVMLTTRTETHYTFLVFRYPENITIILK